MPLPCYLLFPRVPRVNVKILTQTCKGGLTNDNCGCCQVCAKVEGEVCGGLWDEDGYCDQGLFCDTGNKPWFRMARGKCQRQATTTISPPTTTTTKATKLRVLYDRFNGN